MREIEQVGTQGVRGRERTFRIQEFGWGVAMSDNEFVVVV